MNTGKPRARLHVDRSPFIYPRPTSTYHRIQELKP